MISAATDPEGRTAFQLTSGGAVYELDAGPPWFYGDSHPLKAYVGQVVTVAGEKRLDSNEIDVQAIDGKVIREPGRPPWAGGWRRVGSSHPGWSQKKADRFQARFGDCFPPGQCRKQAAEGDTPTP